MASLALSKYVFNFDGQPLTEKKKVEGESGELSTIDVPITASRMIINALVAAVPEDDKKPRTPFEIGEAKLRDYELAFRIKEADEPDKIVNLTSEEITLIKERVAICYTTVAVGQVWNILEGK